MAIRANSIEEYYKLATRRLEELEEIANSEFEKETEAEAAERIRLTQILNSIRTEILQGDTFTIYNGNFQGFNFDRATYESELSQLEEILTNRYDELVLRR